MNYSKLVENAMKNARDFKEIAEKLLEEKRKLVEEKERAYEKGFQSGLEAGSRLAAPTADSEVGNVPRETAFHFDREPSAKAKREWPSIFFAHDPIGEIQQEQCLHKLCADGLMAWGNVMMKQRMPESLGVVLAAIGGRLGCSATPEGLMAWSDVNPIRLDALPAPLPQGEVQGSRRAEAQKCPEVGK